MSHQAVFAGKDDFKVADVQSRRVGSQGNCDAETRCPAHGTARGIREDPALKGARIAGCCT